MKGEIRDGHLLWVDNGISYDLDDSDIWFLTYYSPEETGGPAELYFHTRYKERYTILGEAATLFVGYHMARGEEEDRTAIRGIAIRYVPK